MTEYFLPTTGKLRAQITQYEMLKDQKYRMPQKSYDICCVVQSRRYGRAQSPWDERGAARGGLSSSWASGSRAHAPQRLGETLAKDLHLLTSEILLKF